MKKSRFRYFKQSHHGANTVNCEISEEEFTKLLGEEYYADVSEVCGFGISFPNYEKAKKAVASLKRCKADSTIYACGSMSLVFHKSPSPSTRRRVRDSRYPD